MNNVSLIGRLTKDPELKTTQSGLSVCRFTVAVDRPYSNEQTDFINCIAWRKTADFITSYFRKGQRIALIGSIQTGSYTGKDGKTVYTTEVNANNVEFCESKKRDGGEDGGSVNNSSAETDDMPFDDDLPF